ncbi:regucalcin-like isoform X2 [Sitophilus oryzae]|uniref:Regucalcin n=1 Tax=Sitophilus oryzae TaxID=7048 RepID=A0A6J2YEH8_SITOR|nr:regucalcin-like isoform X2 [Sitophilus oryzae]
MALENHKRRTCQLRFKNPAVIQVTEPAHHAEGPVWDARVGKLYFVDLHQGKILAYDYANDSTEVAAEFPGNDLVPIILTKKDPNVVIVGLNRTVARVKLYNKDSKPEPFHTVQEEHPKNRFNDGKADVKGRLWFGTMGYETLDGKVDLNVGALFKFNPADLTKPTVEITEISIGNGLAWNGDNTKFYYIDSVTYEVVQYDFNADNGTISNRKVVFSTKDKGMGVPDGMTVDIDDNLWVALYGGGSVIQVNPKTGDLLRRIPLSAQYTTSAIWGGPNLDILFVTTSRRSLTSDEKDKQPAAGSLFAITNLGTKGRLEYMTDL